MALSIAATNTYSKSDAGVNSHPINLPAGISSGDLLLVFAIFNAAPTVTDPSGWSVLASNSTSGDVARIYAKIADGSEGATVTVTLSGNQRAHAASYRITGHRNGVSSSEIAVSTAVDADTATPDPPNLTPSWGSAENLWIAVDLCSSSAFTFSSYPTNYSLGQLNAQSGNNNNANAVSVAARLLTATSEDPGSFTTVTSRPRSVYTLAVRPGGLSIAADAGSYAVTGTAATLKIGRKVVADAGAYAISGQTANLKHGWKIAAGVGGYSLTGNDATLTKGDATNKTIGASAGSYAFTGATASLLHAWKIAAGQGGYSLSGQDAALKYGRKVGAQTGAHAITGADATFVRTRRVAADVGGYTLTGVSAALKRTRVLDAAAGSYNVTGVTVSLVTIIPASPIADLPVLGSFVLGIETPDRVLKIDAGEPEPLHVRSSQFGPLKVSAGVRELLTA